jgi:hypothetical protein
MRHVEPDIRFLGVGERRVAAGAKERIRIPRLRNELCKAEWISAELLNGPGWINKLRISYRPQDLSECRL